MILFSHTGCTRIQTKDEVKAITPINISRENEASDSELEEPFSPVVSEYIPGTDSSDSDDNLQFNKGLQEKQTQKKRKYLPFQGTFSSSTAKKTKLDEVSENSPYDISLAATPSSSLLQFKRITTPDSFKEILEAVQRHGIVPTPSNKRVGLATNRKNKILGETHESHVKIFFVASTSKVYKKDEHAEQTSSQLALLHTGTTTPSTIETAQSYENHSVPSPAPSASTRQGEHAEQTTNSQRALKDTGTTGPSITETAYSYEFYPAPSPVSDLIEEQPTKIEFICITIYGIPKR